MAGAGYKLFNTGDVLTAAQVNTYLMEQTVMVFADAAARTAALSGVVSEGMISYLKDTNAVEVYNGSAWVASDDPNAIQNTIVDAKGDLIAATANDTPARLAVGNNGETLVADSSASTGLRWSGATTQNPVINSAFDIWQRNTSIAGSAGSYLYTADRWQMNNVTTFTVSRQATGDTTNLPFIQYCGRVARNSGSTSTSLNIIYNSFETTNSIPFAGKTVTLSFYARAGANFSSSSNILNAILRSGTGTDQSAMTGYTGASDIISATPTLTTTWQRFTYTGTVGATANELAIGFYYTPTGTAGAADFFEVTGVQLDVGSVALPYRRNSATLAGELAACQRYYFRTQDKQIYSTHGFGFANSATGAVVAINLPVTMRVRPTAIDYANLATQSGSVGGTVNAITVLNFEADTSSNQIAMVNATTAGGMTVNQPVRIINNNNSSGYLGLNAEL